MNRNSALIDEKAFNVWQNDLKAIEIKILEMNKIG